MFTNLSLAIFELVSLVAPSQVVCLHFADGKGAGEAAENRNYLSSRMSEEVSEIIRVLQLVTYDEDEWDSDNLTVMKKNMGIIEGKMQTAHDWLNDPYALLGGVGEKSIRQILSHALKVADRSLPLDANHIRKLSGEFVKICSKRPMNAAATFHHFQVTSDL